MQFVRKNPFLELTNVNAGFQYKQFIQDFSKEHIKMIKRSTMEASLML